MHGFQEAVSGFNSWLNNIVWGFPALALIIGFGVYITLRLNFIQFRHLNTVMKNTVGKMFKKGESGDGEVTPFQAVSTALAGSLGTGNIAGVTSAVTLGGPGAIFWIVVSSIIGSATKYSEILLSLKFRERNDEGDYVGGPMYYIKNGLGKNWQWLSSLFCIFAAIASFGTGNGVQVANIADSFNTALQQFIPGVEAEQSKINIIIGIFLMIVIGIILIGGVKRIGSVAERIVPAMAVFYIGAIIIVICYHYRQIPEMLREIFVGAFSPKAVVGGVAGFTIKNAVSWGFKRGVFTNEAGLGTAPMAHAASSEEVPVKQAFYGIFEVTSTCIVCLLNGLLVLIALSPDQINYGIEGSSYLNVKALGTVFGDKAGAVIIAITLGLFSFTTIISWGLYGMRCTEYLFGTRAIKIYSIIYAIVCFIGANTDLGLVWAISDTTNGLMIIPNIIALFGLSNTVVDETRKFFSNKDNY